MSSPIYKVVVLGEGRVGKTSLSLKYVNDQFDDKQISTINASYLEKKQKLENNQTVKLAIWDTAGQEKYNAIAPVYYKDAVGAIIVYQITSKESFQKVKKWVEELELQAPKGIVLMIAGNKADLNSLRNVDKNTVEKFAKAHGAIHYEVSAKNGLNVNELFRNLAEQINKNKSEGVAVSKLGKKNPRLMVENDKKPQKKQCC